jgi:Kef-type K+ transport system membrane component KefB
MTFGVLALIILAGIAGPLLAFGRQALLPVVVGELLAGVVIGISGFRWLDPTEPTTAFLAEIGFAMLMFAAGMNVPLRQPGLLSGLRRGGLAAVIAALLAVPFGIAAARTTGTHHAAIYALLLASGSAAILLPALEEQRLLDDPRALTVMAQVALADVAAIVALPLVLEPGKALEAAVGGVLVAVCILLLYGVTRLLNHRPWVRQVRQWSKKRGWALDLRLSLLILFGLAWIAQRSGTSVLIAAFGVGLMVAAIGGPKRLSRQVAGVAQGFMVPLFFVVLGARIDLRALAQHANLIALAALLVALNAAVHVLAALLTRQPLAAGLAATAQIGVPAAVVTLGLQRDILTAGEGSAIVAAALASLALTAAGVNLLGRRRVAPVSELPAAAEQKA